MSGLKTQLAAAGCAIVVEAVVAAAQCLLLDYWGFIIVLATWPFMLWVAYLVALSRLESLLKEIS